MTIEEKKAAVRMYMKSLKSNANLVNSMLEEGHFEAAKMTQVQFCEQFEEAVEAMNKIFYPEDAEEEEPKPAVVETKKRKVTV